MNGHLQKDSLVRIQIVQSLEERLQLIVRRNRSPKLKETLDEFIEQNAKRLNAEEFEDSFQTVVTLICEQLSSPRKKDGCIYRSIYNAVSKLIDINNNLNTSYGSLLSIYRSKVELTSIPIEAIIDIKYINPWELYILMQTNIEDFSVRDISQLTGISKTLIAEDLKDIKCQL